MSATSRRAALLLVVLAMLAGLVSSRNSLRALVAQVSASQENALFILGEEDGPDLLSVTATIARIDPLQGALTVRLETEAGGELSADDGTLAQDVCLYVNGAEFDFEEGEVIGPIELTTGLCGSSFTYPEDRYQGYLEVSATTDDGESLPLQAEGYLQAEGFALTKGPLEAVFDQGVPEWEEGAFRVVLDVERSQPVKQFARSLLALQWLLALAGLSVTLRVALGGRKCEPALFTWLTALLFVVPQLRSVMVGVPALGVSVDFLGFLCCEGLLALSLATLVLVWQSRRGL